jgi:hypothetical protein
LGTGRINGIFLHSADRAKQLVGDQGPQINLLTIRRDLAKFRASMEQNVGMVCRLSLKENITVFFHRPFDPQPGNGAYIIIGGGTKNRHAADCVFDIR